EVVGVPISHIIPGEPSVTAEMIRADEVPAHVETQLVGRGGERRHVAWDTVVLHDEAGAVTGVASVGQDVTDRRRIEALKDQVIAIVGHELRTPIGAVRGALQVLRRRLRELGPQEQQLLEMAVRNSDRALRLASDLLDYERLDAGAAPLHPSPITGEALLAEAREVLAIAAEEAGVRLEFDVTPCTVRVDVSRLVQVLINLGGNAIKFSPRGGVVRLSAGVEGGEVLLRVIDEGRGIPADQLDAIFDRFAQVQASDATRGSGLGLAIARAIVRQHGGRIWAESVEGRGSTFLVALPAADPT
ncbi:MAG TPA: ATP-binding protein, partial [Gemmatimonadaceae bacterium]|nr:ATP-binding protein [Gemmatimonadaceae bacterium]